jgi:acetyl-CoA C-acetyltransferase
VGKSGAQVPVIVGVGQLANKDPNRIASPLDLAGDAVERAVADAAASTSLLALVDAIYKTPTSVFGPDRPLADLLAERFGLDAGTRIGSSFSGASPLTLMAQACEAVTSGQAKVALIAGAIAEDSFKRAKAMGIEPVAPQAAPWSQGSANRVEIEREDLMREDIARKFRGAEGGAGVTGPSDIFALLESAFAAEAGRTPTEQRHWLGALMAPFTEVAASRPDLAWFPVARTPHELSDATADNRLVSEPYTKRMNAFPIVDLSAAVLVTTDARADELGVPADRRVYPWSTAHCSEVGPPSTRTHIHRSVALRAAIERALRNAQVGVDDIGSFDLYSCFPAAVQLSRDVLGLDPADPRRLTLTGGLPYFGGPGANYVTHAIACAVEACRKAPGDNSLVVGLGGAPSDFAAGVFSTDAPAETWAFDDCDDVTATLEAARVPVADDREGFATVEAMTIIHDRVEGPTRVPLVASFDDGTRIGARAASIELAQSLTGVSLVGTKVRIYRSDGTTYFDPA